MTPSDRNRAIRALAMQRNLTDADRAELQHLQADKRRGIVPNTHDLLRDLARAKAAFQLLAVKATWCTR